MCDVEYNFEQLFGKRRYVVCKTREDAEQFLNAAYKLHPAKFYSGNTPSWFLDMTWYQYAEIVCPKDGIGYEFSGSYICYCRPSFFIEENWERVPYESVIIPIVSQSTWELQPLSLLFEGSVIP